MAFRVEGLRHGSAAWQNPNRVLSVKSTVFAAIEPDPVPSIGGPI